MVLAFGGSNPSAPTNIHQEVTIASIAGRAEALALDIHDGQAYYGTEGSFRRDFVSFHLRPGVDIIRGLGGGEVEQAVFWLHDAIEDTDMTLEGLEERGMPEEVVSGVERMTLWPGQSYGQHLAELSGLPQASGLKIVDSGRNLDAALELRRHMSPEEYDICVRKYAGNITVLAPRFLGSGGGPAWDRFVEDEAERAQAILDGHRGRTAASPVPGPPRPLYAS